MALDHALRTLERQVLTMDPEMALTAWIAVNIGTTALPYGHALWRKPMAFRMAAGADLILARD